MTDQPDQFTKSLLQEWRVIQGPAGSEVVVPLPAVMDLKAAAPLASQLLSLRGQTVTLDGSKVQRIGGLCLQVLLSACAMWSSDQATLSIGNPSPSLTEDLSLLGASSLLPLSA